MGTIISRPTTIRISAITSETVISRLASQMQSGSWLNISSSISGLTHFVGGPVSGIRTGYSDKMAYDPKGKFLYWIGCDHNQQQIFVKFSEATGVWEKMPDTPFNSATKHGYNHSTFDTIHNHLYHRPYRENAVQRWDGSTWTPVPYSQNLGYQSAANGCEWFPEMGTNGRIIIFQVENGTNGEVISIDPVTKAVETHADGATLAGAGDPHNFAFYSHVHKLVWFGGGNGSRKSWTIDRNGVVKACSDTPSDLQPIGPGNVMTLAFCNPQNGNFIAVTNANKWYEFNPSTNVWSAKSGVAQMFSTQVYDAQQPVWGTIAAPMIAYGVVALVKSFTQTQPAQMWLYKP